MFVIGLKGLGYIGCNLTFLGNRFILLSNESSYATDSVKCLSPILGYKLIVLSLEYDAKLPFATVVNINSLFNSFQEFPIIIHGVLHIFVVHT